MNMPAPIQKIDTDSELSFPVSDTKVLNTDSAKTLRTLLEYAGIDTALYGVGKAKSIEALFAEIKKQDSIVSVDSQGNIHREVRVAAAHIYSTANGVVTHKLVEKKQIYVPSHVQPTTEKEALALALKDEIGEPRFRIRNLPTSLSELTRSSETFENAIIRGIGEELQIEINPEDAWPLESQEEQRISPSYPGLHSDYSKQFFRYHIDVDGNNHREFYIDVDPISPEENLVGIFVWQEVD